MRKLITLTLLLALFAASCQKDESVLEINSEANYDSLFEDIDAPSSPEPISRKQLDRSVFESIAGGNLFNWHTATDEILWSGVVRGDSALAIGYKPVGMGDISDIMHTIDINDPKWIEARETIINLLLQEEREDRNNPALQRSDIIIDMHETLPIIDVRVGGYFTVAKVRRLPQIDFCEAIAYQISGDPVEVETQEKSIGSCPPLSHVHNFDPSGYGPGCINEANPNSEWYSTTPSSSKVPWQYYHPSTRISSAWFKSEGDNITIGMIDTGTSPRQTKLNSQFATGMSTGRFISRVGQFNPYYPIPFTRKDGPNDDCGHGTLMAGKMAGPRNGNSIIGVAYKANLVAVRGANDVLLGSWPERKGVQNSFMYLADRGGVRIISMSMGNPFFHINSIASAVNYAHGKGILIFCAAGTSTSVTNTGTIFPATMSGKVFAVTGVKDSWPSRKTKCTVCHSDNFVDFVVPMQRIQNDRGRFFANNCVTTSSLMMEGNTPARVGGSSIATATMAGNAALVWAQNPSMNRTAVVNFLKNAADIYPGRHSQFGWGVVNVNNAVSAATPPLSVTISGPSKIINSGFYTWTASTSNGASAPTYNWSRTAINTSSATFSSCHANGSSYGCYVSVSGSSSGWQSVARVNVTATASGQTASANILITR